MNFRAKSTAALLLTLLILIPSFAACLSSDPSPGTAETSSVTETEAETTDGTIRDDLPDMNLDGRQFNFLLRQEVNYEFSVEQTGDIVNDAVYQRNLDISERFNLVINYIEKPGNWDNHATFRELITSSVMAGDGAFDIVTGQSNITTPLSAQKIYVDLADAKYINYNKPWWKDSYHENLAMFGRIYTVHGDFALTALVESCVIFFNQKLRENYNLDDPYEMVRAGTWDLDACTEYMKDMPADLDGDGALAVEKDLFGFNGANNEVIPFFMSTGLSLVTEPVDGIRTFDGFPDERSIDVFERLKTLVTANQIIKIPAAYNSSQLTMFTENRLLMLGAVLKSVESLRDMEENFGIIPYPKYDEKQGEYRTRVIRRYTVGSIPITAADADLCTLLLEALGCEGYNSIRPTYYEVALKHKYVRDEGAEDILDIISGSAYFDFTDIYYSDLGAIVDFMSGYILGNSDSVASAFESRRSGVTAQLEALYESYSDTE